MSKTQLFGAIAEFYEYSMRENCDYAGWADYVTGIVKQSVKGGAKGIDFACGSGYFTRALKRSGYSVTGVDISPEMLTSAQKITAKENLFVPYIKGDMTNFKPFEKADFITVINDGINCIEPDKLDKTFKNFSHIINKGGILHFDVSSVYKLKNIIGNNTFCEDDDDYSYIWFNELFQEKVVMDMSVFLKGEDGRFIKRESTLTEFLYDIKTLKNALENNNFEVFNISGDMGGQLNEKSERINITAVKR